MGLCAHNNAIIDFVHTSVHRLYCCSKLPPQNVSAVQYSQMFYSYPINFLSIIIIITFIKMLQATWILAIWTVWEYICPGCSVRGHVRLYNTLRLGSLETLHLIGTAIGVHCIVLYYVLFRYYFCDSITYLLTRHFTIPEIV